MYNQNSDHKAAGSAGAPPPISPRISFSSDFVFGSQIRPPVSYSDAPVSDFEFSVNNFPMLSADELFFKGRLLPLKEDGGGGGGSTRITTLKDELQHEDGDEFSLRPPKNPAPSRWRGFLGLRKSHIGSKKPEKEKKSPFLQDGSQCSSHSQEFSD